MQIYHSGQSFTRFLCKLQLFTYYISTCLGLFYGWKLQSILQLKIHLKSPNWIIFRDPNITTSSTFCQPDTIQILEHSIILFCSIIKYKNFSRIKTSQKLFWWWMKVFFTLPENREDKFGPLNHNAKPSSFICLMSMTNLRAFM